MADKEELKSAKEAEKAAQKAKEDRIKQSKPKANKEPFFPRVIAAIKKFFKDFVGTVKKIVWPTGSTVLKNSIVTLVVIIVIGLAVYGIDQGLTALFKGGSSLAQNMGIDYAAGKLEDSTDSAIENVSNVTVQNATDAALEDSAAQ